MKQHYKQWTAGFLVAVFAVLCVCGGFVYTVDPCFYYHAPQETGVYFNERYQNAGLAKNVPADTAVLGTSMVANYRASQVAETFGGTAVKLTLPDGYLSEFDQVLNVLWRNQQPRRVLFGLDINILIRDESGLTGILPTYLYNDNPLDDLQYLLNKDTLFYSAYALREKQQGTARTLDEAYTWDEGIWWNHLTALENYDRPVPVTESLEASAYLENARRNAQVILRWAEEHPDTEFTVFFPPYSLLYWDKQQRTGTTEAIFAALDWTVRYLQENVSQSNLRLFFLPAATEITENLDYYCDYIHCSGEADTRVLDRLENGAYELTPENREETLANWHDFVVHYDYDQFWEESFWKQWNQEHPA